MKILVFTTLYPNNVWPNHGVFIKERMTRVARLEGCELKVVASVPYFPPLRLGTRWKFSQVVRKEMREGIETVHPRYFITPKVGMVFYGCTMFLSLLPYVRSLQKNFAFELIDSHFLYPDGMAAVLLGCYLRKPVIVSARGSDVNVYKDFRFIRPLLRWTVLHANRVIAVSEALKGAIATLGLPTDKVAVIPNGVDSEKFSPMSKVEARRCVGLPDGPVLLSVGHLTANKGFDLLVRALKMLHQHGEHDLSLVIIGEGGFRPALEQLIASLRLSSRVRLVGAVPHQALSPWYNAADLFCLVSAREGWPNVILEALACGTPVVATAVGGIPEVLRSEKVGLLTERSMEKIAESITRALRRPWKEDEIVQYARQYQWEHAASAIVSLFRDVLASHGSLSSTAPFTRERRVG